MRKLKITVIAVIILIALISILELGLHISGVMILSEQEIRERGRIKKKGSFHIVCIGDALTAFGAQQSYPAQLEDLLNREELGIRFKVDNLGVYADSSICLIKLEDFLSRLRPDMVVAMMGINDGQEVSIYEYIPSFRPQSLNFIKQLRLYKLVNLFWDRLSPQRNKYQAAPIESTAHLKISGDFKDREREYRGLIKSDPQDYTSYIILGRLYREGLKYAAAEDILKQAIEIDPQRDWAYLELGWCYQDQGRYLQAEEMLNKAIEKNPANHWSYVELVWWYSMMGEYAKAEEIYKRSIEIDSAKYLKYINLIRWYFVNGRYGSAEEILKRVLKIYPKKYRVYIGLGQCYNLQSKYAAAEDILKQAIEIDPQRDWAYLELGWCYQNQGRYLRAEEVLNKALAINPTNTHTFIQLAHCYQLQDKFDQAEAMFKRAVELNPRNDSFFAALAIFYERQGRQRLANEYQKEAQEIRLEYYNTQTVNNYNRLKRVLDDLNIRLVCVQYPMRSILTLRRTFDNQAGIIFVDNQHAFRQAIESSSYDDYFLDNFGGDFGLPTPKASSILAKNIAEVILKECFNSW